MNRWTDLLTSFGMSMLLHGLLVLGVVWFWTLRPPELRPVFQDGDVSLAVTFVAAADGGRTTDDGLPAEALAKAGRQTEEDTRRQTADDGRQTADGRRQTTEGRGKRTDDGLPTDLSTMALATVEAPGAKVGQQAAEPLPEEGEDQEILDVATAAPVSTQASASAPEDGLPAEALAKAGRQLEEDTGRRTSDASLRKTPDSSAAPPSDALRQGVSGAVRRKSEIRPYYPLGARLRGEEGAVTVRVWVNGSGRARRCEVARSSGFPALDEAALDAARRARYVSTRPGAWSAEAETTLTFRFQLKE